MPQSHPTPGPVRLLSPVRFLARKAEWRARRNFTSVLFSWSHQATGPIRLETAVRLWFDRMIRRTPRIPVRCPYGHRTGPARESSMFFIPYGTRKGPCGTRKGTVRHTYGHARELIQPELTKIPHGRRIWPYGTRTGPLQSPHGLFTGCLGYQNPYGARKLIMHALTLYGPRTGRQNSYGAALGPCGPREWTYDFCTKQSGNSPGVWCDWGINMSILYHQNNKKILFAKHQLFLWLTHPKWRHSGLFPPGPFYSIFEPENASLW